MYFVGWHRTLPFACAVSKSLGVRVLLALLLAAAMGHGPLHRHAAVPDTVAAQCGGDAHAPHPQDDGSNKPTHDRGESPCQTCILIAGLDLPTVAVALSVPSLATAPLLVGDDSTPPSHLSWSRLLLRGPPQAC